MYFLSGEKEECYGCRGCEEVCPQKCITIVEDEEHFVYPHIDEDKCIKCGKCVEACPYNAIIKQERPCSKACGMNAIGSDEYGRAGSEKLFSRISKI